MYELIAMALANKLQLGRFVYWRNTFVCNGVSIYDRYLNTAFEEDVKHSIFSLFKYTSLSYICHEMKFYRLALHF